MHLDGLSSSSIKNLSEGEGRKKLAFICVQNEISLADSGRDGEAGDRAGWPFLYGSGERILNRAREGNVLVEGWFVYAHCHAGMGVSAVCERGLGRALL